MMDLKTRILRYVASFIELAVTIGFMVMIIVGKTHEELVSIETLLGIIFTIVVMISILASFFITYKIRNYNLTHIGEGLRFIIYDIMSFTIILVFFMTTLVKMDGNIYLGICIPTMIVGGLMLIASFFLSKKPKIKYILSIAAYVLFIINLLVVTIAASMSGIYELLGYYLPFIVLALINIVTSLITLKSFTVVIEE